YVYPALTISSRRARHRSSGVGELVDLSSLERRVGLWRGHDQLELGPGSLRRCGLAHPADDGECPQSLSGCGACGPLTSPVIFTGSDVRGDSTLHFLTAGIKVAFDRPAQKIV